jgi:hypothetical protein
MRLIHRLILRRYGIPSDFALNHGPQLASSEAVLDELNRGLVALKSEAFDDAGRVDHNRLRGNPAYANYRYCAARLQGFDPATLSDDGERLAFWINLYNALIIDAVIHFGIRRSVQELPGFFWRAAYEVGGNRYASTDIEYGILRANRGHPAIPGPHFGPRDPRRAHSLTRLDPRIHFALVCAARSCPPIAVYKGSEIDPQLALAARAFIRGGVEVDRERGAVCLSQIFQWYAPDFGGRPMGFGNRTPLLQYVGPHLEDEADTGTRRSISGLGTATDP